MSKIKFYRVSLIFILPLEIVQIVNAM